MSSVICYENNVRVKTKRAENVKGTYAETACRKTKYKQRDLSALRKGTARTSPFASCGHGGVFRRYRRLSARVDRLKA